MSGQPYSFTSHFTFLLCYMKNFGVILWILPHRHYRSVIELVMLRAHYIDLSGKASLDPEIEDNISMKRQIEAAKKGRSECYQIVFDEISSLARFQLFLS